MMAKKDLKIGWIGTGVMGNPMCAHLIEAGYPIVIFTRTKSKAENLLRNRAHWADSPAKAAEHADIVFSIVSFPDDVRNIYLGQEGVLTKIRSGGIIVDMTTSSPTLAIEIANKAAQQKVFALDAPVSGGDVGAKNAKLSIMVGGEKKAYEDILPLLNLLGTNINYMGPAGCGQHTKMANQIHIATTMIGTVECLLYAYKAGLDLNDVIKAIGSGAAGSWSINNLGPRIVKRNFDPGFYVEHFIKDLGIALEESKRFGLSMPGLALAQQFYLSAKAMGYSKMGTHALALVFEKLNSMEIKS